jgi:hypothetical protein
MFLIKQLNTVLKAEYGAAAGTAVNMVEMVQQTSHSVNKSLLLETWP